MKKKYFISLLIIATGLTMLTGSCKKEVTKGCTNASATNYNPAATADDGSCMVIPFQGPVNPSFEEDYGGWQIVQGQNGYCSYLTGTGFMPTSGYKYMHIESACSNNFYSSNASIYQNDVDISHSDSIVFDYVIDTHNIYATGGTIDYALFFTGNGTDTLWSRHFGNEAPIIEQRKNFAVALPSSTQPVGKLTFKVWVAGLGCTFDIDNIRMK